jgi:hypothetical protein
MVETTEIFLRFVVDNEIMTKDRSL